MPIEDYLRYMPLELTTKRTHGDEELMQNWYWLTRNETDLVFYCVGDQFCTPLANLSLRVSNKINKKYYSRFNFTVKRIECVYIPTLMSGKIRYLQND